jgi:hypothetical protein
MVSDFKTVWEGEATAQIGLRSPHCWGFQITHDSLQSVGHLWTRDQPYSEAHTHSTHNKHERPTSMHLSGIQTLDPDNQGAAELRLRPHGHGFGLHPWYLAKIWPYSRKPWIERKCIPPKCWYGLTNLQGVKTHDNSIDLFLFSPHILTRKIGIVHACIISMYKWGLP